MSNYTGIVKWYDQERGFGIISATDGSDVFLHHTQVIEKGREKDLMRGEQVGFDMIFYEDKGPSAANVHTLQ